MMTRKLSDADRTAVDLVLDHLQAAGAGNGNGNGGDGVVMVSQSVSDERLSAVQRVLSALDAMPAAEPPSDLAVRTLQKIARAGDAAARPMTQQPQQPFIDPSAPLA
jgi:hypothetical protein